MLGDNGSEFSNPSALEIDPQGEDRTRVFYCDPQAPYQKPAVENNHSLIRRIMMNHINSYKRANLGDKAPCEVFAALYGEELLRRMGAVLIPADKVILRPYLLKK